MSILFNANVLSRIFQETFSFFKYFSSWCVKIRNHENLVFFASVGRKGSDKLARTCLMPEPCFNNNKIKGEDLAPAKCI